MLLFWQNFSGCKIPKVSCMRFFSFLILFVLIAGSVEAKAGSFFQPKTEAQVTFEKRPLQIIRQDGSSVQIEVEMALNNRQRAQGLMNRKTLPDQSGMLFIFPQPVPAAFWMKNTYIALDMLFIRQDGTIAHIHPNAVPLDETPIKSPEAVIAVLELRGGQAEALNITPNDRIVLTSP